jgi:hypothetical protein
MVSGQVVVGRDGSPIPDAIVTIVDENTRTASDYTTDSNGNYYAYFNEGSRLRIQPSLGAGHPFNSYVNCTPQVGMVYNLDGNETESVLKLVES